MSDDMLLGHDGKPWPQTMDAKLWADEFCKRNSASDYGTMLSWFANAIMIGWDTAHWGHDKEKCERSRTQMTLGKLISALKVMPNEARVSNLNNAHSYRGYYSNLAFERGIGEIPASELLSACQSAMDKVFEGYKGGDFLMGAHTPVWVANYGQEGSKLIAIGCDGEIETAEDD